MINRGTIDKFLSKPITKRVSQIPVYAKRIIYYKRAQRERALLRDADDRDFCSLFIDRRSFRIDGDLLGYFRKRVSPRPFLSKDISLEKRDAERIVGLAEEIILHRFNILGRDYTFNGPIDWSNNFQGKSWIKGSYKYLNSVLFSNDYRNEHYIGDIKIPWELNKHHHFVTLGQAYLLTEDERYAREFLSQISNWIDVNPCGMNIPWSQTVIVAERAISWLFALIIFMRSPSLAPEAFTKILKALAQHAYYIEAHLEFAVKTTNHIIAGLSALYLVAVFFPEFTRSKRWERSALKLLTEEIKKQILPDGVDYEQSINYHRYVLEFLLLVAVFSYLNGIRLPVILKARLQKMLDFTMHMTQPNGRVQTIGDVDGARVWNFSYREINDHRHCLSVGSLLFERGDLKFAAGGNIADVIWFFGKEGLEKYRAIRPEMPPERSKAFHAGGYYIMRTGWQEDDTWLFFDCGPVGKGRHRKAECVSLHGHDDILNIGLYADKRPLLLDSGMFTYTGSRKWHNYFRSAKAHNILTIDDKDLSIHTATWTMKNVASPYFIKWRTGNDFDYVCGMHDGYDTLKPPVKTKREVLFLKGRKKIVIRDTLAGSFEHKVNLYFHLPPEIAPVEECPLSYRLSGEVTVKAFFKAGRGRIIESWYAPDYGIKLPSRTIEIEGILALPAEIYTLIDIKTEDCLQREQVEDFFKSYGI